MLEEPQYTRPADFRGWVVPEILLSGDHARIAEWRRQARLERTSARRPDLMAVRPPSPPVTSQLLYRCDDCGLHYATKQLAESCYDHCTTHHACSITITAQSVERQQGQYASPESD